MKTVLLISMCLLLMVTCAFAQTTTAGHSPPLHNAMPAEMQGITLDNLHTQPAIFHVTDEQANARMSALLSVNVDMADVMSEARYRARRDRAKGNVEANSDGNSQARQCGGQSRLWQYGQAVHTTRL